MLRHLTKQCGYKQPTGLLNLDGQAFVALGRIPEGIATYKAVIAQMEGGTNVPVALAPEQESLHS